MLFKNIIYWYLFLIVFSLLGGTALNFLDFLPAFILMFLIITIYGCGLLSSLPIKSSAKISYNTDFTYYYNFESNKRVFFFITLGSPFISYFVTYFYTGKSASEIFSSLILGASLYNDYQSYFSENDISQLTFDKIPAILSAVFMKYSLILTLISFVLTKNKSVLQFLYSSIITGSYLYFSIARGTTFEVFEILMLIWFSLILSNTLNHKKTIFFSKSTFLLISLALVALLGYEYNISARYSFKTDISCPTEQLCIDTSSIIYYFSESIAILFNKLSGYFTFGLYYTSRFAVDVWFSSITSFTAYLFPGNYFFEDMNLKMCGLLLDCGAAWKPDLLKAFDSIGIIATFFLIYFLGKLSSKIIQHLVLNSNNINQNINLIFLLFFIFLFVISLPVGNFVFASSSNAIITIFLALNSFIKNAFFKLF